MKFDDKYTCGVRWKKYNVFELFEMVTAMQLYQCTLITCKYVWRLPHMEGVFMGFLVSLDTFMERVD